jgi:hypothetical protein
MASIPILQLNSNRYPIQHPTRYTDQYNFVTTEALARCDVSVLVGDIVRGISSSFHYRKYIVNLSSVSNGYR